MSIRRIRFEGGIIRDKNLVHAIFAQLPGNSLDTRAAENGAHLFTEDVRQLPGRAGQFEADLAEAAVPLFCNNPYTFCHVHILRHSTSIQ